MRLETCFQIMCSEEHAQSVFLYMERSLDYTPLACRQALKTYGKWSSYHIVSRGRSFASIVQQIQVMKDAAYVMDMIALQDADSRRAASGNDKDYRLEQLYARIRNIHLATAKTRQKKKVQVRRTILAVYPNLENYPAALYIIMLFLGKPRELIARGTPKLRLL